MNAYAILRRARAVLIALALSGALGLAAGAPARADQTDPRLDDLFARLAGRDARDPETVENRIWEIWRKSQSPTAQLLLDRAEAAIAAGEVELAAELADHATGIAPSFAEAWNARAQIYFVTGEYELALEPLQKVLELEPRHFGAYFSLGEVFSLLGNEKAAYAAYMESLKYNPHNEEARKSADRLHDSAVGRGI